MVTSHILNVVIPSLVQNHMETSAQQISMFTEETYPCLLADSHAKTLRLQNNMVKVSKGYKAAEQVSFTKWLEPSEKLDQNTLLPKTYQTFLKLTEEQTLDQFSPNWPDWGIMQNGEFVVLQKSVPRITEAGCIWLSTPKASDCLKDRLSFPMYQRRHHRSPGSLPEHLYRLVGVVHGRMNPQFFAWMMGYPVNWLGNIYTDTETP